MIDYTTYTLGNGLQVIAHRERASRMAAVNILYKVGARDEEPSHTGFAHLFEHLMFRGTRHVPDFDIVLQRACGENNAFTNNDYTDFYITLPVDNLETALWLEADRMQGLDISAEALRAEKLVVIEEFKQRYLNRPYGDLWMRLRDMAYKQHPYRWATIGLTPDHISSATLRHVKDFYAAHYTPQNAILSVAADCDPQKVFELAEKWFGGIERPAAASKPLTPEPEQTEARRESVSTDVPAICITIAFKMCGRTERGFYYGDIISDLLAGGTSSRLHHRLVKERRLFESTNAYVTGDADPGLFVVTGMLLPGVSVEEGEKALWSELEKLKSEAVGDYELEKVKNKFETNTTFGELNVMNKAMNLGFYAFLGDLPLINNEIDIFRSVSADQIQQAAQTMFVAERSSTLIYMPQDAEK